MAALADPDDESGEGGGGSAHEEEEEEETLNCKRAEREGGRGGVAEQPYYSLC